MIKALWFMLKIALLVAAAVWVAEQAGDVRIAWEDYVLTIHLGFFLLILMGVILLALFAYNTIKTFVDFPKSYRRYKEVKDLQNGYRAVTAGLTAVAAGDTKTAVKQAKKAARLLPQDNGLPLLLQAQAARLEGREDDAQASFVALLEHKDAGFLGVRGLLQAALDAGEDERALELAQQALKMHPKQPWILRVVFDLQVRLQAWSSALDTLYIAEKARAFNAAEVKAVRTAIWLAQAEDDVRRGERSLALRRLKQAFALSPGFSPAAVRLAKFYNNNGKRSKAVAVVERAWRIRPHPDLVDMWAYLIPPGKSAEPMAQIKWFEKLVELYPHAAEGYEALGRVAFKEQLWGDARINLEKAAEMAPNEALYKMLAELSKRAGESEDVQDAWLDRAQEALPAPAWVCRETGRVYEEWIPVTLPHGAFNTIEWGLPYMSGGEQKTGQLSGYGSEAVLLDAPV